MASSGEIPKNPASNLSTSLMKPPRLTLILDALLNSGANIASTFQRSAGISPNASFFPLNKSQNSSGEFTSPGNLHPIPMIAKGSLFFILNLFTSF